MAKVLMSLSFLTLLVFVLTSCSRLLRPTAGITKKQKQNRSVNQGSQVNNDSAITKEYGKKNTYNAASAFNGTLLSNITYTNAVNYKGVQQQLTIDVYKPADAEGKKFPAIFLMHGGSFTGGDKANLASTCSKLANNGYVVISVNYRLGWGFVSRANTSCNDTTRLKEAIYRSVQDVHSAMHYIAAHADDYSVDKDWMFVGGQSAGAITGLITAYLKEKDAEGFFPGCSQKLGPLDKAANDTNAGYTLKGVISMWGAFIDPALITDQTALPTIFFQGERDRAVPFNSGAFAPCSSATVVYGTNPLYNRLKALGETSIAHVDPQGGHGVFDEDFRISNILCFLNDVRQGIKKQVYLTGMQYSCDNNQR